MGTGKFNDTIDKNAMGVGGEGGVDTLLVTSYNRNWDKPCPYWPLGSNAH